MTMAQNVTALAQRIGAEVKSVKALAVAAAPMIGEVRLIAYATPEPGWLICDGGVYEAAQYPDLYAKIGTTYDMTGSLVDGDFPVPDLRNRVPVQVGQGAIRDIVLGQIGGMGNRVLNGLAKFVLGVNNLPAHKHTTTAKMRTTVSPATKTVIPSNDSYIGTAGGTQGAIYTTTEPAGGSYLNPNAIEVATENVGEGAEVNATTTTEVAAIVPPFVGMNYVIYAGVPT